MTKQTIEVPDIGGAEDVEVIEVCVSVGDEVEAEDSLIVLESDKASMEVPVPVAGKVLNIKLSVGDKVSQGDVILELETAEEAEQKEEAKAEPKSEPEPEPNKEPAEKKAAAAEKKPAASKQKAAGKPQRETIKVPDIGGGENVDVIEISVAEGDEIAEGDSMIVLESDKASMEVPAPKGGKVLSISVKEGDKVSEGDVILELEAAPEEAAESEPETEAEAEPEPEQEQKKAESKEPAKEEPAAAAQPARREAKEQAAAPGAKVYAGPAVRKIARELGVDLEKVDGSGPRGRIVKEDVQEYVKDALSGKATTGAGIPAVPEIDFSQFGEVEVKPMSRLHQLTAENMHRSWLNVPHVTQFDDADITELEDFRAALKKEAEARGVRVTPLAFILKAAAAALKAHPTFNASLGSDGESIVYKKYVHIGVAVDTENGLMVPVIRDVDQKSVWELSAETAELAQKAKDRKLKPQQMQGGCFTISSLGPIGGTGFTPIVNTPEVAILAVSKLAVKPVWNGKEFEPRKMLPLSLSYDHRAVNGADAGRFLTDLVGLLADIRRLVL